MRIDTILFDWDGTLIDTSRATFRAFQKSLLDLDISLEADLYEKIYSPDWYQMYRVLQLPRQKWGEADELWIHYYGRETPSLVDGVRHTLDELVRNCCLGVVTSGISSRVRREIDLLGLSRIFSTVICGDDVRHKKPHPEGLETAMKQIGKTAGACCYVGDTPEDMEMGRRAGVLTVGIRSGYPSSRKLPYENPDFCIESITQLPGIHPLYSGADSEQKGKAGHSENQIRRPGRQGRQEKTVVPHGFE